MTNAEAIKTLRANYPDACYEQLREAVDVAIEALKARDAAGDTISRQAAIDAIRASTSKYTGFMEMEMYTDDDAVEAINGVPSAQPERKTGKWVVDEEFIDCSVCKREKWSRVPYENLVKQFRFCPNCGARMDGGEDDEHSD